MAHIADCLAGPRRSVELYSYIANEVSPSDILHERIREEISSSKDNKGAFVWRMQQPIEPRKYQLFPLQETLPIRSDMAKQSPSLDGKIVSVVLPGTSALDRSPYGSAPRLIREPSLGRRRKASVSDLGLMATVHEVAMDSPTIPGRPPIHERSISAPGQGSWGHNSFRNTIRNKISDPVLFERTGYNTSSNMDTLGPAQCSPSTKPPLSPKSLAPLKIPANISSQGHAAASNLMTIEKPQTSMTSAADGPPKSGLSLEDNGSPYSSQSRTPYTPYSPPTTTTSMSSHSAATTPVSAVENHSPVQDITEPRGSSPFSQSRVQTESPVSRGHRRHESETSIMNRGRPKKRLDGSSTKRSLSKRRADKKAFETLPQGMRAIEASSKYEVFEIESLKQQAISEAARFEVLNSKDVDQLARELRALDERCDYLRETHRSLRSGRRNLHDRICTYLRSVRLARFSHESLLKQEEALYELDRSIDDWSDKLELAENRRMRVRQKLLEHVAAAITLSVPKTRSETQESDAKNQESHILQRPTMENTPPRSPIKLERSLNTSPLRLAAPVAISTKSSEHNDNIYADGRPSAESIRIYADSDMYALLADVEQEINRMGENWTLQTEILNPMVFEKTGTNNIVRINEQQRNEMANFV